VLAHAAFDDRRHHPHCPVEVDLADFIARQIIPKVLTIDPYDRHLSGFWFGAIGAVVRVP
jgi:hypothetical protein